MSHNRENLRLSLLDLQATLTAPSQTVAAALLPQTHTQPSGSSSNATQTHSIANSNSSSSGNLSGTTTNNSSNSYGLSISSGSVSQAVSMATTTVARLSKAGFGATATGSGGGVGGGSGGAGTIYQNDKCDRLKKMTSITCSDSEDDSERRAQFEINTKWNLGGYEGVSLVAPTTN